VLSVDLVRSGAALTCCATAEPVFPSHTLRIPTFVIRSSALWADTSCAAYQSAGAGPSHLARPFGSSAVAGGSRIEHFDATLTDRLHKRRIAGVGVPIRIMSCRVRSLILTGLFPGSRLAAGRRLMTPYAMMLFRSCQNGVTRDLRVTLV
jgi:hypothetical protein